jgi:hypothetical protein
VHASSSSSSEALDVHAWLLRHQRRVYSQNGEDGFLEALLALVEEVQGGDGYGQPQPQPQQQQQQQQRVPRTYVEFGAEDGLECNTRLLRERHNWTGVLLDGSHEDSDRGLHRAFITPSNINALLRRFGAAEGPNRLGVMSIDLDYYDFYVWRCVPSVV